MLDLGLSSLSLEQVRALPATLLGIELAFEKPKFPLTVIAHLASTSRVHEYACACLGVSVF